MAQPDSIELKFQISFRELYEASLITTIYATRYVIGTLFLLTGVALLSLLIEITVSAGAFAGTVWDTLSPLAFASPIVAITLFLVPYLRSRQFMRRENNEGLRHYIFSAEAIFVETRFGSAHLNWNSLIRVRETRKYFLLFSSPQFANIVPKRAFSTKEDISSFRSLVRQHVPKARLLE